VLSFHGWSEEMACQVVGFGPESMDHAQLLQQQNLIVSKQLLLKFHQRTVPEALFAAVRLYPYLHAVE